MTKYMYVTEACVYNHTDLPVGTKVEIVEDNSGCTFRYRGKPQEGKWAGANYGRDGVLFMAHELTDEAPRKFAIGDQVRVIIEGIPDTGRRGIITSDTEGRRFPYKMTGPTGVWSEDALDFDVEAAAPATDASELEAAYERIAELEAMVRLANMAFSFYGQCHSQKGNDGKAELNFYLAGAMECALED